ncbi:MAG: hypothetical protein DSZ23_05740 [Thermodesulfatator sp.]|nr:MAG: hypothetical protein DSZ23_05740 [Thermodesulfatator sp.]
MNRIPGSGWAAILLCLLFLIVPGCCDKERKLPQYSLKDIPIFDLSTSYSNYEWENDLKYLYQPLPKPLKDARIIVNKKKRILYLFSGETLMRIYPVNLGPDPLRDKIKQGDGRTPEGRFFICNKNPRSKYYKALGISYPSREDALRGLKQGLITKQQYKEIISAIDHGRKPPWFTRLGGAVCIHGGGIGWDWTRGCIALRNPDVNELFQVVSVGTPVTIISGLPEREVGHGSMLTSISDGRGHRSLD